MDKINMYSLAHFNSYSDTWDDQIFVIANSIQTALDILKPLFEDIKAQTEVKSIDGDVYLTFISNGDEYTITEYRNCYNRAIYY